MTTRKKSKRTTVEVERSERKRERKGSEMESERKNCGRESAKEKRGGRER